MSLLLEFIQFLESKPEDTPIDHYKGGWRGCAVGDFCRDRELDESPRELAELLGHPVTDFLGLEGPTDPSNTYGELAVELRELTGNPKNRILRTVGQLIDHVERSLVAQGERSRALDGACYYRRNAHGRVLSCGVGFLISDGAYEDSMETLELSEVMPRADLVDHTAIQGILGDEGKEYLLFKSIQRIHDRYDPEYWPEKFTELREEYNEYI